MFRNSRLGFADVMSIDGTLISFTFESCLKYYKHFVHIPNLEYGATSSIVNVLKLLT
jgi:hypothetical protein